MYKSHKSRLVWLIILILSPILFILFDEKLALKSGYLHNLSFIIAALIVTMTIYIILDLIIKKFPAFLDKGIWKNPINMLIIGSLALSVCVFAMLFSSNMDLTPRMNKLLTFMMAYPIVFVLTIMIDSFYKGFMKANREKRLFFSSISIVFVLAIMILMSELGNL